MAPAPRSSADEREASVILHPLVIINISDHYSRSVAQHAYRTTRSTTNIQAEPSDDPEPEAPILFTPSTQEVRVIGLLLGTQTGRVIEVCHSFELLANFDETNHKIVVDEGFMHNRMEQYKQIFAQYSVVGWYSTGKSVSEEDIELHKGVFSNLEQAPVYMMVDAKGCTNTNTTSLGSGGGSVSRRDVKRNGKMESDGGRENGSSGNEGPIVLYETEFRVVDGEPKTLFTAISYRLASADSERIALDHVSRHTIGDGIDSGSAVVNQHLEDLHRSVKMLCQRLEIVQKFLTATLNGEIEKNYDLLRKVSALCAWIPSLQSEDFTKALDEERQDSRIVSFLAAVTKSLCILHEVSETSGIREKDAMEQVRGARSRSTGRLTMLSGLSAAFSEK